MDHSVSEYSPLLCPSTTGPGYFSGCVVAGWQTTVLDGVHMETASSFVDCAVVAHELSHVMSCYLVSIGSGPVECEVDALLGGAVGALEDSDPDVWVPRPAGYSGKRLHP